MGGGRQFVKNNRTKYSRRGTGRRPGAPRFTRAWDMNAAPFNMPRAGGRTGGYRRQNVRSGGFLGVEHKFYDTFLVNDGLNTPADASAGEMDPSTTSLISTVPQGDGASERIGKKIQIESVQITGNIYIPIQDETSSLDVTPQVYIALVEDHQTNGATLASEDVFTNPSVNQGLCCSPLKNLLSTGRFTTHKVWQLEMNSSPATNAVGATDMNIMGTRIPFSCYKKLNMVVNFNGGTTASVANVVDNSLHMIAYVNDTTWGALISYNARIRFVG